MGRGMKTIDLNIDYSDLMDEEELKNKTTAKMLANVKEIVENSVLSSLEDATLQGKRYINGITQRRVDRVLDLIEASDDGKITVDDKLLVIFQKMWEARLTLPAGGEHRKLVQRIDKRICPDAYKKDEER